VHAFYRVTSDDFEVVLEELRDIRSGHATDPETRLDVHPLPDEGREAHRRRSTGAPGKTPRSQRRASRSRDSSRSSAAPGMRSSPRP
jgi:hypothetical protein